MMLYSDQKKNDVPTGGRWFWDIDMMQAEYNKDPSQFMLALHAPICYALYPNASAFTYNMPDSKPINQRAYEIIPPNTPCKAYADLAFASQADLDNILAHYKHNAMREYGIDALFEVSDLSDCSARIIISNMPLANNHDGQMKGFFTNADKLFSIDQDIYSPAYHRQISITDQQDPDHIARFLVTNPAVPVVVNDQALVSDALKELYKDFVLSRFNHEPLELTHQQHAEIEANITRMQAEATNPHTEQLHMPRTKLDSIVRAISPLDMHAMSNQV